MTVRLYLAPAEFNGPDKRGPKYFRWRYDPDPPAMTAGSVFFDDFGLEPTFLVAADVTPAEQSTLDVLSDVTVIPANLDNNVGAANLATVQAALESLNIPGDAITAATTYRQIVRGVRAIFAVAQNFWARRADNGQVGQIFPPGITLSTTLGDLSQAVRDDLQASATSLGYSYDGLTLQSTLRDVLKALANQQSPSTMLGLQI